MTLFRRTTFWLGIILISLSWRTAFHLVTPPAAVRAALIAFTGFVCVYTSSRWAARHSCSVGGHAGSRSAPYLITSCVVLLASGVSTGALLRVAACLHDIDIPGYLASAVEGLSSRLGVLDGMVVFWDGAGIRRVRLTFEGLGLYEMWYVAVGLVAAKAGYTPRERRAGLARRAALGFALFTIYAVIRFAALVAIAVEFGRPNMLWHPSSTILSCVPIALLMARVPVPCAAGAQVSPRRMGMLALALVLLTGTGLMPKSPREECGQAASARVIIDESHSDWEWATIPFDTTSFGIKAEYNYYCFRDYIGRFHEVNVNADTLRPRVVDACDILIIKTPTAPYAPNEIDTIVEFVREGGGLFLIGDHTNLFGMTTYLNSIAERFGMRFRNDDTFDLTTGGFSSHVSMGLWTPSLMRGIERFGFLTSCTIEGGLGIEPVMLGCGLGSEDGDYGHPNFFGDISYDLSDRFGVFLQAAGRPFGLGRVLLFTDSTCFSNFCMFSPGTPEVLLRFLDYLEGGCLRRASGEPVSRHRTVLVDTTHSHASFYEYIGQTARPPCEHFEEFYLSLARVGMFPMGGNIGEIGRECPSEPGRFPCVHTLVVVNPMGSFTHSERDVVAEFVASGGTLLVLDSVTNSRSTANDLLGAFQMGIAIRPRVADRLKGDSPGDAVIPALVVYGGDSVATDRPGRMTASRTQYGMGTVLVIVDSYIVSQVGLGRPLQHTHMYSDSRSQYRALFALLDVIK